MSVQSQTGGYGEFAYNVEKVADERFACEMTFGRRGEKVFVKRHEGRSINHVISGALEGMAHYFRRLDEFDQDVDWEAVEYDANGGVVKKRFHVILHYERIADEESKFEAMHNSLLGNSIVEQASVTLIQINPTVEIEPIIRGSHET